MKKLLVIAAIAALSSAACAATPRGGGGGGGGGGFSAGCFDSSSSVLSLIYDGSIASYKNTQVATNSTGCGSNPVNTYVTLVLAADAASAITDCQTGPDPATNAATGLAALGFDSMPPNGWLCTHPNTISAALLQPHDCFPIGSASIEYLGPRNAVANAALHPDSTTCSTAVTSLWTYVQQSTQAAALVACQVIDPTFTTANSLAAIQNIPNDTYLCT